MKPTARSSRLSLLQGTVITTVVLCPLIIPYAEIAASVIYPQYAAPKVRVTVYFESDCPDTRAFFANQLQPTYSLLADIIDLEFVPFGKAVARPVRDANSRVVNFEFTCQNGELECLGNRIMSCAQRSLPTTTQYHFFSCMIAAIDAVPTRDDPVSAGQSCALGLGLDWSTIQSCAYDTQGAFLLYYNGVKTAALRPQLYYVPTITINGVYDQVSLNASLSCLQQQVCLAYGAPHPYCGGLG